MDANAFLWLGQILLAAAFAAAGLGHSLGYDRMTANPRMGWMGDVGRQNMGIIGGLETLGAVGLILPAATGILPWLTPLAAAALALLMLLAMVFHARRPGEGANIAFNAVLGILALVVAYGRFVIEPL